MLPPPMLVLMLVLMLVSPRPKKIQNTDRWDGMGWEEQTS